MLCHPPVQTTFLQGIANLMRSAQNRYGETTRAAAAVIGLPIDTSHVRIARSCSMMK